MTDFLGHVSAQAGYEKRLAALPVVAGLWGQSADAAARPLLNLVTSDTPEFRVSKTALVTRGLRNALTGRLRQANRMPLDITIVGADRQG